MRAATARTTHTIGSGVMMIEVCGLTKRYGEVLAVDDLTFAVRPGEVTGFLGPNGAGKSTTLRMILGLDAASSGTATVGGRPYSAQPAPLKAVGALLDAGAVLPSRTAYHHLLALAAGNGIPRSRVAKVLIVQAFAPALPGAVGDRVEKYWPPIAGGQIITGYRDPALLAPWSGLAVMAGCVAVLLTVAFIVFRKRDA
ncbi:ABC transporter ATP-binding protein [Streptomyces bingchenggensis BCW-1]|uniref:ABC transporter ATP-binding protein n=1 Tax=Streptomyces bingchenggensis (strain BCW-1) TaxID=749414 RepID=D7BYJ6_STRBB|nr:ABC transporter ATP-binding protein [Streptomyces bingchenggensis BCW-1]